MKTFEEALRTIWRPVEVDLKTTGEEIQAGAEPFDSVMGEARNHPDTTGMVYAVIRMVQAGALTPETALLTMLLNGIRIGMEMERMEIRS